MYRRLRNLWDRVRPLPAFVDPLVVVKETAEQTEALFAAGLLRERGIQATVRVSEPSHDVPTLATGWAAVVVPRDLEERALEVLRGV